jgi:UDP-glucose 4-epimerase
VNVVVTGGAGFIGANLCRRLLEEDSIERVIVVDDLSSGTLANLEGVDVDFVEGSIVDAALLDEAFAGCHAVVHLAARGSVPRSIEDPVATHVANATGTLHVLEAARRAGNLHVILASSSSVYGANPELPKREDMRTLPVSPYAASKLAAESYALAHQRSYGLPVLALRFFNVFGPLQPAGHAYAAVIPAFTAAAMAGQPIPMHGDGEQSRDFTYVGTVIEVLTDAVVREVTHPEAVNLAFGTRVSLLGIVAKLEAILGRPLEIHHGDPRAGDVRHSQADATRLHELFPEVAAVELDDGLRATVAWFQSRS